MAPAVSALTILGSLLTASAFAPPLAPLPTSGGVSRSSSSSRSIGSVQEGSGGRAASCLKSTPNVDLSEFDDDDDDDEWGEDRWDFENDRWKTNRELQVEDSNRKVQEKLAKRVQELDNIPPEPYQLACYELDPALGLPHYWNSEDYNEMMGLPPPSHYDKKQVLKDRRADEDARALAAVWEMPPSAEEKRRLRANPVDWYDMPEAKRKRYMAMSRSGSGQRYTLPLFDPARTDLGPLWEDNDGVEPERKLSGSK